MRRIALTAALAAALGLGLAQPASAQTDTRALYDRIDRLERDISVLNQQMSRGAGASSTMVVRSPALGGGVASSGGGGDAVAPGMAARLDERLDQLEDQLRQLTGKVEEANFKAAQVGKQLERMQADIDLRFKDVQGTAQPQQTSLPAAQSAAPQTAPNGAPVLIPPKGVNLGGNSAEGNGPAPGPQVLGTMPDRDAKDAKKAAAAAPAPLRKDPQGLYDDAYALAQRGDYAGAERGFQAFLQQHPTHQLAGNAHYWLGDIAFTRKDFATAAKTFGEAYKKYPKHSKAPDMLYKLGASFAELDMKKEACKTYGLLFAEHPDMADRIKRAATASRQKLGCQ